MSFTSKDDNSNKVAETNRKAAEDKRAAAAEALRLENERADAQAILEKQSLSDKELARKKKQKSLLAASAADDDVTSLLG